MKLRVRCPKCSWEFSTRSLNVVRCRRCGRSFKIFPKNSKGNFKKSRIVRIEEGTLEDLYRLFYERVKRAKRGC